MVDLQCPIKEQWNTVRGKSQDDPKNSDMTSLRDYDDSQKFSARNSHENFIRSCLTEPKPSLVNVLLEPAVPLEFSDKADGLIGRTRAELRDDIDQRTFDIF